MAMRMRTSLGIALGDEKKIPGPLTVGSGLASERKEGKIDQNQASKN